MFAENTPLPTRVRTVEAYSAAVQLWQKSGNCSLEHVGHHKKILTWFLMALEFGDPFLPTTYVDGHVTTGDGSGDDAYDDLPTDDAYDDLPTEEPADDDNDALDNDTIVSAPPRAQPDDDTYNPQRRPEYSHGNFVRARRLAMPGDFFKGPKSRASTVSKNLGIGYCEMLTLRLALGMESFNRVLVACGLLCHGRQGMSPLEPGFQCPGGLACYEYPINRPCQANGDYSNGVCMLTKKDHPLFGIWTCSGCNKILRNRQSRTLKIQALGQEAVQAADRRHFNAYQAEQRVMIENGDAQALERKEQRRQYYQDWCKSRKSRNYSTGSEWKKKGKNFSYPQPVTDLMSQALEKWIVVYQDYKIIWPDVVALFRDICDLEAHNYQDSYKKTAAMFQHRKEEIVWYSHPMETIALQYLNRPLLEPGQSFSKTWDVKRQYLPANARPFKGDKQAKAALRSQVLDEIYSTTI